MAEELKIKIRNTEAASVEIIPTDDGIEICIVKKEHPSRAKESNADNTEMLRAFCSKMKEQEDTDKKELKRFWEFYSPKMPTWKGKVHPDKLWEKWIKD